MQHQSVMLTEAIEGLNIQPDGFYLDATFGRGGHSQAILERLSSQGRLVAIDKDLSALDFAKVHLNHESRFQGIQGSFALMKEISQDLGWVGKVSGVLFDLGVSSPQLDNAERGFSFLRDGPLDMRMDTSVSFSAADFIQKADLAELASVFHEYGEERFSRRIAKAIVEARALKPIERTKDLAEIVKAAHPRWEKHKHPATRVFQAIRIHVNQELLELKQGLEAAFEILAPQGRLVVISFHSLEDRLVKHFMQLKAAGKVWPKELPIRASEFKPCFKILSKAMKPQEEEIAKNPRSRSAILRLGEKIA